MGDGVERSRLTLSRPVPYGRLDDDVPMTLLPELGRGVFSSPGLEGHRDGQHWSPVFAITQIEKNKDNIVIESEDVTAGVHLKTE
ncbi:hypothetical protein, partial [Bacillus cereus group sp. BC329]|uniref:hypothetical protein n=1 Tax=Bacillus cereus group sp. BC329 TaxID=3445307 RepID=UPI003F230B4F